MKDFTQNEKDLMIDMADSFISNVGATITKLKEQNKRDEIKGILKECLSLSDKINAIEIKK